LYRGNFTIGWIGWFAIGIHQTGLPGENSAPSVFFTTEAIFHIQKEALSHQSGIHHSTAFAAALNEINRGKQIKMKRH
jgi:hypothetical protein